MSLLGSSSLAFACGPASAVGKGAWQKEPEPTETPTGLHLRSLGVKPWRGIHPPSLPRALSSSSASCMPTCPVPSPAASPAASTSTNIFCGRAGVSNCSSPLVTICRIICRDGSLTGLLLLAWIAGMPLASKRRMKASFGLIGVVPSETSTPMARDLVMTLAKPSSTLSAASTNFRALRMYAFGLLLRSCAFSSSSCLLTCDLSWS
mmetsp:Transcript_13422/g.31482  ORF Transcript_13422/g.31482 Transcript_13422/m.31482 type:complete len:206 (-) Transcript_13422:362-979(-)